MKKETIIAEVHQLYPSLTIIGLDKKFIIVKDDFGDCKVQWASLLNGSKPTIATALDKTCYFTNKLKVIQPDLVVVGEYIGSLKKIQVKDKYGICNCIANGLLNGQVPCIQSSINPSEYFINQAIEIHGNRYDYSKTNYINAKHKLTVICKEHGEFEQLPNNHLKTNGCLKCSNSNKSGGFYKNEKNFEKYAVMYILKFSNSDEVFFKFGVSVDLKKRINTLENVCNKKYKIEVLKEIKNTVDYCYKLEQRFKQRIHYKKLQYLPQIKFCGRNECFKQ